MGWEGGHDGCAVLQAQAKELIDDGRGTPMEPWLFKILGTLALVAVFLVGPVCAASVLTLRRRKTLANRKSPITRDLLHPPGHSLREQMDDLSGRVNDDLIWLIALPPMVGAAFAMQIAFDGEVRAWRLSWLYGLTIIACIVIVTRRIFRKSAEMDRLRAGYDAEMAVGQELDQLMCQGARIFHDVPCEHFNIDHVVVAPHGVFAVETKGYTKQVQDDGKSGKASATVVFDGSELKFPAWVTQGPLKQAERQAQWLSKWLSSATGDAHSALPVLALPGWFVDRQGRGKVRVFSGRELNGLLKAQGAVPLSPEQFTRAVHQLDQRCRTVAPQFNRMPGNST